MKKFTIAVLVFALAATFAACGCQNNSGANNTSNTSAATTQTTTAPTTATMIDPTIMDPTLDTNIPDPDINTDPSGGTTGLGDAMDNTITDNTRGGNMN